MLRHAMAADDCRSVILAAATGFGKTVTAALIAIQELGARHQPAQRVWFTVDRLSLANQAHHAFMDYGIPSRMIGRVEGGQSAEEREAALERPIVIVSRQAFSLSLVTGRQESDPETWKLGKVFTPTEYPCVIISDECHDQCQKMAKWARHKGIAHIGLSASPGKPELGRYFDAVVTPVTTRALWHMGRLMRPQIAQCDLREELVVDVVGVRKQPSGEYVAGGGGEGDALDAEDTLGGRVAAIAAEMPERLTEVWNEHFGGDRVPTLLFAPTQWSAKVLVDRLSASGISAESYVSSDKWADNTAVMDSFLAGGTDVVVSVGMLARGFDYPDLRLVVDLFPLTKAWWMLLQRIGRLMRTADGKTMAMYVDMGSSWSSLGVRVMDAWHRGFGALGDARPKVVTVNDPRRAPIDVKGDTITCYRCECGAEVHVDDPVCPNCDAQNPAHTCQHCGALHSVRGWGPECATCGELRPRTSTELSAHLVALVRDAGVQVVTQDWADADPEHLAGIAPWIGNEVQLLAEFWRHKLDNKGKSGRPPGKIAFATWIMAVTGDVITDADGPRWQRVRDGLNAAVDRKELVPAERCSPAARRLFGATWARVYGSRPHQPRTGYGRRRETYERSWKPYAPEAAPAPQKPPQGPPEPVQGRLQLSTQSTKDYFDERL